MIKNAVGVAIKPPFSRALSSTSTTASATRPELDHMFHGWTAKQQGWNIATRERQGRVTPFPPPSPRPKGEGRRGLTDRPGSLGTRDRGADSPYPGHLRPPPGGARGLDN